MNREVVFDGILTNRWDRIAGTVHRVEDAGSHLVISPRKRRPSVAVEVEGHADVSLDGARVGPSAIRPGQYLAAIGNYVDHVFRARTLRLYSDRKNPNNARDELQPPAICFWFLDTGEIVIRQVGRPGEEILLKDQEEFDALRANPEYLRHLLDLAHRGELPHRDW